MHICIFEDDLYRNLLPLTYFRPVYDLRCGILTLRERILLHFPTTALTLAVREYLTPLVKEENPDVEVNARDANPTLYVNGRCILSARLAKELRKLKEDCLVMTGDTIVAARLSGDEQMRPSPKGPGGILDFSHLGPTKKVEIEARLVVYPWDLVYANETELVNDFLILTKNGKRVQRSGKIHDAAVLIGKKQIHIGKKSKIDPGAVLDAESGPIFIGGNVRIYPQAVIEGPCYVGDGSYIKIGAKIYGNTSIGPLCKVGGEVEHSILHSCANKQHDGFLGHSYLAPWVNLGAGTTTSNLKNTYGNVKVNVGGQLIDTGKMFVGLTASDHAKTGINATLDTGTMIGPCSNIYGTALPPKHVPPFSWGEAGHLQTYEPEKALDVAVRVMARRNVQATEQYKGVFRHVFEITKNERTGYRV